MVRLMAELPVEPPCTFCVDLIWDIDVRDIPSCQTPEVLRNLSRWFVANVDINLRVGVSQIRAKPRAVERIPGKDIADCLTICKENK